MNKLHYSLAFVLMFALLIAGCGSDENTSLPLASQDAASCYNQHDPDPNDCPAVVSASLNLYLIQENTNLVNIHFVTGTWDEATVTWNNFGSAYDGTVEGTFVPDVIGWKAIDVTSLVQVWSNGDRPNFGLLLDQPDEQFPRGICYAKENGDFMPYLSVCYDDGNCVDIPVLQDAYTWELYPNDTYGEQGRLYVGWENATDLEKQAMLQFELPVCEPQEDDGCTRTVGYWKNHAGFGPQDDEVTPLLPIWLGRADGNKSLFVGDAATAVDVLKKKTYGHNRNGITKLYAQLLAAKLNIVAGASDDDIARVIRRADRFLSNHDYTDWRNLKRWNKWRVLRWKTKLDKYNNGRIGPGHCE